MVKGCWKVCRRSEEKCVVIGRMKWACSFSFEMPFEKAWLVMFVTLKHEIPIKTDWNWEPLTHNHLTFLKMDYFLSYYWLNWKNMLLCIYRILYAFLPYHLMFFLCAFQFCLSLCKTLAHTKNLHCSLQILFVLKINCFDVPLFKKMLWIKALIKCKCTWVNIHLLYTITVTVKCHINVK